MPRYLFYTTEGEAMLLAKHADDVDKGYIQAENSQVLGIGEGENPRRAYELFLAENTWMDDVDVPEDSVFSVEVIGEPVNLSDEYNPDLWAHVGFPEA